MSAADESSPVGGLRVFVASAEQDAEEMACNQVYLSPAVALVAEGAALAADYSPVLACNQVYLFLVAALEL